MTTYNIINESPRKNTLEELLTSEDVMRVLHISKRTLQKMRDCNVLPYAIIGGKALYLPSDVRALISRSYTGNINKEDEL